MHAAGKYRVPVGGVLAVIGAVLLTSCATATRTPYRSFFVPPQARAASSPDQPLPDPPNLAANLYAEEVPNLSTSLSFSVPAAVAPSDSDLLIKQADEQFDAGKQSAQQGNTDDARTEFNRAVDILLTAPENTPDRPKIEHRLEEIVDSIYRYDIDQLGAGAQDDEVSYDKAPLDGILDMTFPVDPSLRNKVIAQVKATASQLPLEESDAVIGAINFFSTERGKKVLVAGLRRSGRYKSMIERILAEEGLPKELIFVAQAESGFMPRARSYKSCVGLWQFAKFRGKEYGLNQTPATDDRMDPEKATRAAAHHLHDLYDHFGDWYLALAAYNCGPGCIDHAVNRTGYADFWTLRRLNVLPKETANYVPVILAMTIMAKNAKDYGLTDLDMDPPMAYDNIELQTPTHLALIADAIEQPISELRDLNPALLKPVAPAGYELHVPKGMLPEVEAAFKIVPPNRRDSWRLHRVESGETLKDLAKRYNTELAMVSTVNHDELPDVGKWVAIPVAYPGDRTARDRTARSHSRTSSSRAHSRKPAPSRSRRSRKRVTVAHRSTKPAHKTQPAGVPASD